MSTTRLTLQRGQEAHQATVNLSTSANITHVEINFDADSLTKDEALIELEKIKQIVMERDWPQLSHSRVA